MGHTKDIHVGLITGIGQSAALRDLPALDVTTPFGPTSTPIRIGEIGGKRIAVIARRGEHEQVLPHLVPNRANVWALASLGIRILVTNTASTGLRDAFAPGCYVVPDQILDLTHGRASTFYDAESLQDGIQIDAADPFDPTLRALAVEALTPTGARIRDFGTIATTNGPRYPTTAEYRWYATAGADLTNMTVRFSHQEWRRSLPARVG